jgi:protein-S-isoprenylcysteine O-methyltransferase Ste14
MLIIYFFTAVNEERQILTSEHEVDYRSYRNRTGLFLPKVSHCWNPNQRA